MRFNPPPNWPPLPQGFVPPPGWQPDPQWGEPPDGWQLWLDDGPMRGLRVPQTWLGRWAAGLVVVLAVVLVTVVVKHSQHGSSGHQVVYRVTGVSANTITYTVAGGQQQAADVALPWSDTEGLRALKHGAQVAISAQNGSTSRAITCEIDIDGAVAVEHTSKGPYAVVSCVAPLS